MAIIGSKRPRRQPSSIDRLDPEIKKTIATLRIDYGWTQAEILEKLIELGAGHISKSALGRHTRTLDDMGAEMREAHEFARALGKEVGDDDAAALSELNAQLLQINIFKLLRAAKDGVAIELDTKGAMEISRALVGVANARKAQLDLIEKAEKRGEERAKKAAAERAVTAARAKGLSRDSIDAIRTAVLGSEA